ncbi:MAG: ParB/RepB/Spo0J family partition protein [Rivularia sp. (in: Bacteria)]|nr:ParB/RepB/Spo0J family partition protein [Rivularia sp. MS3]
MFGGEDSDTSEQSLVQATSNNKTNNTIASEKIKLDPNQPRRYFDQQKLSSLAQSIKELGILEPLLVRPLNDGLYELIAGERRFKAAGIAGLKEVPCVVKEMDDDTVKQVQLIENLQREDLNAYEETIGILELLALRLGITQSEVISLLNRMEKANRKQADNVIRHEGKSGNKTADNVSSSKEKKQADNVIRHERKSEERKADNVIRSDEKSVDKTADNVIRHEGKLADKTADNVIRRSQKPQADNVIRSEDVEIINNVFTSIGRLSPESFRANRLPLLNLSSDIQQALASGRIEYTKARAIARVKDKQQRTKLLKKVISQNLSLTQIKELIKKLQSEEEQEISPKIAASQRVVNIGKQLKGASVWGDARKRKKLEKLLGDIEKLLSEQ